MKMPSRKILSVVLAVAVLASLLATSVFAGQRAVGVGAVSAAQSTMRTGPESDAAELAQLTAGTDSPSPSWRSPPPPIISRRPAPLRRAPPSCAARPS